MRVIFLGLLLLGGNLEAQRPRELRGSARALREQNVVADSFNLSRMKDSAMIKRMIAHGFLIRIPDYGHGFRLDSRLGSGYPNRELMKVARPWVKRFLVREGEHFREFSPGRSLVVTSLVRDHVRQNQLRRGNVNAVRGNTSTNRSPHLTGSTLDITKRGMTAREISWFRQHLVLLERCGWIEATEEMRQPTFHIFVHPNFGERCAT